jgi:hypothetical protein
MKINEAEGRGGGRRLRSSSYLCSSVPSVDRSFFAFEILRDAARHGFGRAEPAAPIILFHGFKRLNGATTAGLSRAA